MSCKRWIFPLVMRVVERKVSKAFKKRRRNLMVTRRTKGKQKEKREGLTYGSGIGVEIIRLESDILASLDTIGTQDVADAEAITGITNTPLNSSTQQLPSKNLSKTQIQQSPVVYYDTETTSRATNCEIIQLSAVSQEKFFDVYISPNGEIAPSASAVHGITIAYNESGRRGLSKNGVFLETKSKLEAFSSFINFLQSVRCNSTLIVSGYNSDVFDTPRLLRVLSEMGKLHELLPQPIYFTDALPSVRKEAWLPKAKSLGVVFKAVTGETFHAHDGLEDARALKKMMEHGKMTSCYKLMKEQARPLQQIAKEVDIKREVSLRIGTFSGNLKEVLSSYMVQKIARSGLTYEMIKDVHDKLSTKGVVALLAGQDKPRVTNKIDVISKIIMFLNNNKY